ncbi:hypothetical protein XU18_3881 [Perkinsela sp. CCAP 1560/4]|nr:hypothetical protein XU18_3881 [Perkinsela sp. CCAP 1560/4]|eukprot:KNH05007.1 hypothetical protein XU18_3881 [Perkinsela sp. CCAP 1560/4]
MTREVITVAAGPVGLQASSYFWKYSDNAEDTRCFRYSERDGKFVSRMVAIFPEEDLAKSASAGGTISPTCTDHITNASHTGSASPAEGDDDLLHTFQEMLSLNIEHGDSFTHPANGEAHESDGTIARHIEALYSQAALQCKGVVPLSERSYATGNGNIATDTHRILEVIRSFLEECDLPDGIQFFSQANNLYGHVVATLLPMIHEEFGHVATVVQGVVGGNSLGINASSLSENDRPNYHTAQALLDINSVLNMNESCTMLLPHVGRSAGNNQLEHNQLEYIGASHRLFTDGYHVSGAQRRKRYTLHELGTHLISHSSARIMSTHMGGFEDSACVGNIEPSDLFSYHALYPHNEGERERAILSSQFISTRCNFEHIHPHVCSLLDQAGDLPSYRQLYAHHAHPKAWKKSAYEGDRLISQQNSLIACFESSSRTGSHFLRPLYGPVAHHRRLPYGVLHRLRGSYSFSEDEEWEVLSDRLCTLVENHENMT